MIESITIIISSILTLLCGAGGVFVFLNNKNKNKIDDRTSSVSEWQSLYNEMKSRLDAQEKQNKQLQIEIINLRETINQLQVELDSYKKYENYIYDLETYNETLLNVLKPLVLENTFNSLLNKKPIRQLNIKKNIKTKEGVKHDKC